MSRKVTTAPTAALALADVLEWYSQRGAGPEARKIFHRLERVADTLQVFPYAGRASVDHEGMFQLTIADHRFMYMIVPDTGDSETAGDIEIVAVFAPGRP